MTAEMRGPEYCPAPRQHCIECGAGLIALASPAGGEGAPPAAGDATMCIECGAIHAIGAGLRIRELTLRERAEYAGDHDVMRAFRALHRGAHFARRAKAQ